LDSRRKRSPQVIQIRPDGHLSSELCDGLSEVPTDYAISDDEVHVWLARIGLPRSRISVLTDILSADERRKSERFHFQADRERHVIGRALARMTIGRLLDRSPESLGFCYNDFGKPHLSCDMNEGGCSSGRIDRKSLDRCRRGARPQ
jgi:hypothetical protein